ncbi:hypothetical protein N0V90_007705 [Kalmusia sp. IMI 367209]|nr:hypothetical protein N0V90_007705 [Kalmusia sp. IMI 367209]
MGEHARYVDQDGVNVVLVHVDIADRQEVADIEVNLYKQLQVVSPLSSLCEDEAKRNQVRFYRTDQKLSDSGGGVTVYYNGKKIEHKKLVMGSLNALVEAIAAALEKQNAH